MVSAINMTECLAKFSVCLQADLLHHLQARGAQQPDTDALARFLSQQGTSGLNNLGGRPL